MAKRKLFYDRKDAKRVDDLTGLGQICIDLKPGRCDSDVYINQKMDLTNLEKWLTKKKKEGNEITYFHCFVAAIGKIIYARPKLNYFVANRHLYKHNDVVISFVAKVSFDDTSEEMMVLIPIEPEDTVFTISEKIKAKVNSFRDKKNSKVDKKGANDAIDVLGKLPNILRIPLVGIFKWCDKKGILPSSLVEDNLYYSSIIVSNLGSIKCGAIYHNITNFGTCSSLATMGEIKPCEVINENGKKEIRKLCEFGINLDERIADGYYFAKSVNILQEYFDNPAILEKRMDECKEDKEIR